MSARDLERTQAVDIMARTKRGPPVSIWDRLAALRASVVAAAFLVVHCSPASLAADAKPATKPAAAAALERAFTGTLPANVAEIRDAILAAVQSGDIHDLQTAIEWNELRPDFGIKAGDDAIEHLKRSSADGAGRETLARLATILSLPPARVAVGRDAENSFVYVWPYLAELPPGALTAAEEVDLYRLMPVAEAKSLRAAKKWTWWRLVISADGTWVAYKKFD